MSMTREDFLRCLHAAFPDRATGASDGGFHVVDSRGTEAHVELRELPPMRMGVLVLPRIEVSYRFPDATPKQLEDFLTALRPYFQRGGG
jgi:hypothetical protein